MSLEADPEHIAAISFLEQLESDPALAERAVVTDLSGRLALAAQLGLTFVEADLRTVIRNWDYHGAWSRWLAPGRIREAVDDLPLLEEDYLLTQTHIEAFRRDGHVLLNGVLSASELAAFRPVVRRGVANFNPENASLAERDLKAFLLVLNLRVRDAAARRFALARRFGKIAAQLLGVKAVRIYLDEAFYKEPGGGVTQWHQDLIYFPLDTDQVITLWLPLVDTSAEMGTLRFASGSHREGNLGYQPLSDDSETHFHKFIAEHGYRITPSVDMKAGEVSAHHGWVLHGAPPNSGKNSREVMALVYYPDGTRIPEPENIYQQHAMQYGFKKHPGELAESHIHQVVYSDGPLHN